MNAIQGNGLTPRVEMINGAGSFKQATQTDRGIKGEPQFKVMGDKENSYVPQEKMSAFDVSKLNEEEKAKLEAELKELNDSISTSGKLLKFRYNDEAKASYVEVIDAATQEVVASLPPEFLIDLSIKMKEIIGMFIDKKM